MVKLRLLFLTTQEDKAEKKIMISCSNNSSLKKKRKNKKAFKALCSIHPIVELAFKVVLLPRVGFTHFFIVYTHTHLHTDPLSAWTGHLL